MHEHHERLRHAQRLHIMLRTAMDRDCCCDDLLPRVNEVVQRMAAGLRRRSVPHEPAAGRCLTQMPRACEPDQDRCCTQQGQIYPPWAAKYLDYKLLKQRIKDILAVGDEPEASSVVSAKKNIFQVSMTLDAL